ncbi:MAG: hypothetical protein ABIH37_05100 [archaeon]
MGDGRKRIERSCDFKGKVINFLRGFSNLNNDFEGSVGEQVILEDNSVIDINMDNKIKVFDLGWLKMGFF